MGSRIVFYVGVAAVFGIIALWPRASVAFRNVWLFVIVPMALWATATDVWNTRQNARHHLSDAAESHDNGDAPNDRHQAGG